MDKYFSNRKSVRTFSDKEVDDAIVKELLEVSAHAPTTGNMQLYSVVITRSAETKALLAPAHFSQPAYMNAPVIVTFCADFNRFVKWCRLSNASPGFDNIQSFVAAALDTVILAQQFVTLAEMHGLGTCYLGTTTYNPDIIAEVLDLPSLVVPVISVALGYPEGESAPSERIPVESFIHYEKYNDYSDSDIHKAYDEKESLPENIKFVKDNQKDTLAQVFTDIRYPRENNELFSTKFTDFIKKAGF